MPRVGSAFAAKRRAPARRAEAAPDFAPDFSGPYEPQALEPDLYAAWEKAGAFAPRPRAKARRGCRGYGISLPPPNVTGSLHMGHALNASLQDILVRFARMQGEAVLWQPGTDHAGIATQLVVEKQLAARGESRKDLGRKRFEEEVWKWKEESGSQILTQLKRLGASCDWGRERFTMDAHFARTVRQLFVRLYRAGLVYRAKRLVHWDPMLQTAVSDLEVRPQPAKGHLWHMRYPLMAGDGPGTDAIVVATTRPETLFGDMAVCVHPADERYKALIGRKVWLPLAERPIPIVADEMADPEAGSGAVKITPAHDFQDFALAERHQLEMCNILDARAHLNDAVPPAFRGLERFAARKAVVAALDEAGLLERTEAHDHMVPHGERTDCVLEPRLTEQWYVDAAKLAAPARAAVRRGTTRFVPENWNKTYFHWLDNIQPWCISRQLWWGHQLPVWYGPDGTPFVAERAAEAAAAARTHYGAPVRLRRDEDVLDTWFSSALWPFVTLGWPQDTKALENFYPNQCLVTGLDIIFFWVARMMMMGLYCTKKVPFRTVYIHALVRDARGQKMSKSRGNVMDPMGVMERYGADALRFTLASMASPGRDVRLEDGRVQGYRNFASKLWNAARFADMQGAWQGARRFRPQTARAAHNQWVLSELAETDAALRRALANYRFDLACETLYHFVWHRLCDWYLEWIKPVLGDKKAAAHAETRACLGWVLMQIFHLLHPFMPYLTEALWQRARQGQGIQNTRAAFLMQQDWPQLKKPAGFARAQREIAAVLDLVQKIRSLRSEWQVPPKTLLALHYQAPSRLAAQLKAHEGALTRLARLKSCAPAKTFAPRTLQWKMGAGKMGAAHYALVLEDAVALDAHRPRLQKELAACESELMRLTRKLAQPEFAAKAPPEIIAATRTRLAAAQSRRDDLTHALQGLTS